MVGLSPLGNPVGLLTDFSTNSFSYAYDLYGTRALTAGGTGSGAGQNPYSFKAGIQDRGTGLVKFGLRWYEPTTGTWTQQDTLDAPLDPSNANRYAYAGGDPVNLSDLTGKAVSACAANIAIATGAGIATGLLAAGAFLLAPTVIGGVSLGTAAGFAGAFTGVMAAQAAVDCSLGL